MPQEFTSWEAIYKRQWTMFPDDSCHDGSQLSFTTQTGNRVSAALADGRIVESDLFIAADGSNSEMRRRLLPDVLPNYAGYVAWRGTLEEAEAGPTSNPFSTIHSRFPKPVPADTSWFTSFRERTRTSDPGIAG